MPEVFNFLYTTMTALLPTQLHPIPLPGVFSTALIWPTSITLPINDDLLEKTVPVPLAFKKLSPIIKAEQDKFYESLTCR
jgi:hypothetical protein